MSATPDWLQESALQQFFAATRQAGGEARAVGGCVRDFLLGIEGADVDLASTLLPEKTMEIAAQQGWKAIPTGIAHGTVTVVVPGRVLEVTTLRRDVSTDGRRATVAYTDNWQEDASRRDFTMNALLMDSVGTITDFFAGCDDITAQRVRFIGDAAMRISEDGLRILRYFRFLATHGKPPAEDDALAAIVAQKAMITQLSGERIANEMRKLLSAPSPAYVLRLMMETGVAPLIFGGAIDAGRMIRLQMLENQADYQASVWARVVCLIPGMRPALQTVVEGIVDRWKLARHEAKQLRQLMESPAFDAAAPRHIHTRMLRLHGAPAYLDWLLTQAATTPGVDTSPYVALAREFTSPVFPLTAKDLLAHGMTEGKALGDTLARLEKQWEESEYRLSKAALLDGIFSS